MEVRNPARFYRGITLAIAGSAIAPSTSTPTASTSRAIQSLCASRSASEVGSVSVTRSVTSIPEALRSALTEWIRSSTRPSVRSSSSSSTSKATLIPSSSAVAQPGSS